MKSIIHELLTASVVLYLYVPEIYIYTCMTCIFSMCMCARVCMYAQAVPVVLYLYIPFTLCRCFKDAHIVNIHAYIHMQSHPRWLIVFLCTANLRIIDARYQLSTVFSTSLLLENRWNHDNRRQLLWEWQYDKDYSYSFYVCISHACMLCAFVHVCVHLFTATVTDEEGQQHIFLFIGLINNKVCNLRWINNKVCNLRWINNKVCNLRWL